MVSLSIKIIFLLIKYKFKVFFLKVKDIINFCSSFVVYVNCLIIWLEKLLGNKDMWLINRVNGNIFFS